MSVFNTSVDRLMRGLVVRRMRPQIRYDRGDTAIIVVTSARAVRPGELPNGEELMRWARAADISVFSTSTNQLADTGASPKRRSGDEFDDLPADALDLRSGLAANDVVLDPFPGLSAFTNPALLTALADRQLDRVIIVGSRTDVEIDSTARDATEAGLHTTVISDCCTGSSAVGHRATVDITLPRLVHAVLTLAELRALTR
ncbi:cysteine hydrolase family protein [Nocardia fluminea]|uniref:cysteine hydrolase family protein n=1 Tax=Nocardia fluminea TaxID=134984 RepID=UPI0034152D5C